MGRWSRVLLAALVGFQLARLLTREQGPFGVFERIRDRLAPRTELVTCPYCCGLWFASLAWLGLATHPGRILLPWLAALGVHTLLEQASEAIEAAYSNAGSQTVFVPAPIKVQFANAADGRSTDLHDIEDALRHLVVDVRR